MRGRLPRLIALRRRDKKRLEALAHSGGAIQRVVRRARALLAMARRQTVVQALARQVQMSRNGIWCLCRRYEKRGLEVLQDTSRSGRPRQFSPLGAGTGGAACLLRTGGFGPAPDPLVDPQPGAGRSRQGHCASYRSFDRVAHFAKRHSATPPLPLLEDPHAQRRLCQAGQLHSLVLRASWPLGGQIKTGRTVSEKSAGNACENRQRGPCHIQV